MRTNKFYLSAMTVGFCLSINADCAYPQKKETPVKAAQTESETKSKAEREKIAVENLISDAQSQQAEIAADALIRLVESKKLSPRSGK